MGHKKSTFQKTFLLRLTPDQMGLIQQCTGRIVDTLNLEEYSDRLTMSRAGEPAGSPAMWDGKGLVIELTDDQKQLVRRLTGKAFSQLRIQRRQG